MGSAAVVVGFRDVATAAVAAGSGSGAATPPLPVSVPPPKRPGDKGRPQDGLLSRCVSGG